MTSGVPPATQRSRSGSPYRAIHLRTRLAIRIAPWLSIRLSKPTREQAERALQVARENGWLTPRGFVWDEQSESPSRGRA